MSNVAIEILFIILLITGNGVLAMSELAVISARKSRLHHLAEQGNAGAQAALALAGEPNQFLSTVQIGITLVGILAGAFGGATVAEQLAPRIANIGALAQYSEAIGVAIVVLTITYLSLVVGELVPKRLALNNPERIAVRVARPMRFLSVIASPAVRVLSLSTDVVLRVLGVKPSGEPPVTETEIRMLIRQGTLAGVFEEAEEDLVGNIFRLGDRQVSALMTPRHEIAWLDTNDPPDANQRVFSESAFSRFPVCKDSIDNVIGVVRAKDVLAQLLSGKTFDLVAVLRPPLLIDEGMRALKCLELFKESGKHLGLIVDKHGGVEGLVTHHDLLEAIVGDFSATGAPVEPKAVQREDGSWLIDGGMNIDEFKDLFQLKRLPGDEWGTFQTVGGFIMARLGHIPSVAEHFECEGLRFEVVDMDGRRVDEALVSVLPERGEVDGS